MTLAMSHGLHALAVVQVVQVLVPRCPSTPVSDALQSASEAPQSLPLAMRLGWVENPAGAALRELDPLDVSEALRLQAQRAIEQLAQGTRVTPWPWSGASVAYLRAAFGEPRCTAALLRQWSRNVDPGPPTIQNQRQLRQQFGGLLRLLGRA